jgi:type II secretory pathway component PulC
MAPFRSLIWLLNAALLGTVSYSSAALSMRVLEQRLERDAPLAVAMQSRAPQREAAAPLPLSTFQPVLDANIFGARRSEVKPATAAGGAGGANGTRAAAPAGPHRLELLLTGTAVMGERAFAMVADAGGRNEQVYRLWDCLPAGSNHPSRTCEGAQGKLMVVRAKEIVVEYRGERITFLLATDRPLSASAAARAAPPRPPAAAGGALAAPTEGAGTPFPITQQGNALEVRVPGAEVNKAFENFADVLKQARVVPYTDETGQGFQIRNIRPGSIFERIGLSNFDKIKAVNGEPITTADQAVRLLTMFRNEREISLDLQRGEQDLKLNYVIE